MPELLTFLTYSGGEKRKMSLDVWFREDVERLVRAVARARGGLTTDERTVLEAICDGFGLEPAEILPKEKRLLPAAYYEREENSQ